MLHHIGTRLARSISVAQAVKFDAFEFGQEDRMNAHCNEGNSMRCLPAERVPAEVAQQPFNTCASVRMKLVEQFLSFCEWTTIRFLLEGCDDVPVTKVGHLATSRTTREAMAILPSLRYCHVSSR